jgi:argininosuccinate synthase
MLYSNFKSSQSTLPSRVIEGEKLIELGSYNAAIAMVVAGLEEILITKLGEHKERYSLSQLVKKIDADWLTEPLKNELKEIMTIRNQAVHGHLSVSLTKSDAQKTLKKVKYIIYKLT